MGSPVRGGDVGSCPCVSAEVFVWKHFALACEHDIRSPLDFLGEKVSEAIALLQSIGADPAAILAPGS